MGIAILKKINEYMPYCLKKPFSKIIRNKLIENKVFLDTYSKLLQYDLMNEDEIKEYQMMMLRDTLIHAYEHTQYYHTLFDGVSFNVYNIESLDVLKQIPILTKKDLKHHFEELMADDIKDSYLVTTGGTTGEPTQVQMGKNAIYREWAFVYHYWSKFGYDYKTSKLATLRGVDLGDRLSEINPLYAEVRLNPFTMNGSNIEKYLKIIDEYGADILYGYPSAVFNFCRLAEKQSINLKSRFKSVFLISENLYEFQETLIKRVLECDIAMFYGHSERAVFAEKYGESYTFNEMYGVTELSKSNEPIVTGFINRKTPLIRYVVDDQVEIKDDRTSIFGHHTCEELVGANDERIAMASINFHDNTFQKIRAYQFVQNEVGKCILNLESDDRLTTAEIAAIKDRVERKFSKGFIIEVNQVEKIITSSRGKYKMLISNINNISRRGDTN